MFLQFRDTLAHRLAHPTVISRHRLPHRLQIVFNLPVIRSTKKPYSLNLIFMLQKFNVLYVRISFSYCEFVTSLSQLIIFRHPVNINLPIQAFCLAFL